ncbi:MAG: DUF4422 domain-containing protein [Treponema sp.]|nr:DUF4422 domain-containing protein [Treponema sp.]
MKYNDNTMKQKIKILVCCHKKSELPDNNDSVFLPIHVGAALSSEMLGIQRDDKNNLDVCDNISNKNKSYCELTALYWAWKNIKTIFPKIEYIGLNHYRRFFNFDEMLAHDWNLRPINDVKNYKINYSKLFQYLKNNYGIIAKKKIYPYSLVVDYSVVHLSEDFRVLENLIKQDYPEYFNDFIDIFYCNNALSHFNMFIWKYDDFEKYCEWLFGILFKLEERIDISKYNPVQARIWGYIAERLLNLYVAKNKMKMKYLPVNVYNDKKESNLKYYLNRIRYNIAFKLSKPELKNVLDEKKKC